jgi:hypothetical protein
MSLKGEVLKAASDQAKELSDSEIPLRLLYAGSETEAPRTRDLLRRGPRGPDSSGISQYPPKRSETTSFNLRA